MIHLAIDTSNADELISRLIVAHLNAVLIDRDGTLEIYMEI